MTFDKSSPYCGRTMPELFKETGLVLMCLVFISLYTVMVSGDEALLLNKVYTDPTWQWLTVYRFAPDGFGWQRHSNEYVTCDLQLTRTNSTDSWLVSDFIPSRDAKCVTLQLGFTARRCDARFPFCKQHIKLHAYQSDSIKPGEVSRDLIIAGNFTFIGNATADKVWSTGQPRLVNVVNITFPVSRKGFYIGFQDNGACVAVREVRLTYLYCPRTIIGGAVFNTTNAPLTGNVVQVAGECLGMSESLLNGNTSHMQCLSNGTWSNSERVMCHCKAGYQPVLQVCKACPPRMYKEKTGNTNCLPCAKNTVSSEARNSCTCSPGYYRRPGGLPDSSCTGPPLAPRELTSTFLAPRAVLVAWKPPLNDGGSDDVTYSITCHQCGHTSIDEVNGTSNPCNETCSNMLQYSPSASNIVYTHVAIFNLIPGAVYVFRITSRNGVSGIARNSSISYAEVRVSVATPAIPKVQTTYVGTEVIVLSWSAQGGVIYHALFNYSVECSKCEYADVGCVTSCHAPCGNAIQYRPQKEHIRVSYVIASGLERNTKYRFTVYVTGRVNHGSHVSGANGTSICVTTKKYIMGEGATKKGSDGEVITLILQLSLGVSGGLLFCAIVMFIVTIHLRRRWYKSVVEKTPNSNKPTHPTTFRKDFEPYDNVMYMEETFFNVKREVRFKNEGMR